MLKGDMGMAAKNIQLPELGEGVTEGELVKWLVKPGDKIVADQPVAEMMTDKATVEVPSPTAGTVQELKVKEGNIVEVGTVMLIIDAVDSVAPGAPGTPVVSKSAATPSAPAPAATPAHSQVPTVAVAARGGAIAAPASSIQPPVANANVLATPATRRLARESGVDINQISGSGMAGRVTRDDVLARSYSTSDQALTGLVPAFVGAASHAVGSLEERVPLKGIRKKIAENLQMAKRVIPHFTLMDEANVTSLVKMREELKVQADKAGIKITYLPFVMKALIATAREFPMFNASIDDVTQEIVYKKYFNIGFAADTPNGLLVPVIKAADHKTIAQLSREINDLAKKAREGKLAIDEMRGATITITNIGSIGGTYATPIINHPEVAILGMYKISDKPVVKQGANGLEIDVIKSMNFTITADHRLIDGAVAANFLKAFMGRIENPGVLMLDMI
jgi:pyruvate dehydrogenase E2 component (dihydrolipoamide acetyltransferase)